MAWLALEKLAPRSDLHPQPLENKRYGKLPPLTLEFPLLRIIFPMFFHAVPNDRFTADESSVERLKQWINNFYLSAF